MTRVTVNAPESLELVTALKFCSDLKSAGQHDEYVVNFSRTRTLTPFGMLIAAAELDRLRQSGSCASIVCTNHDHIELPAVFRLPRVDG
jgi:hypothetical protein